MPTADTREVAEATTHTVIIGAGLLDQEIAWRYDRAPLAPAAIDAERTILGVYADAELDGDPLRSPADLIILLGAAATIIFDGFTRTHQAAHEEHELRLQAVREACLLPPPVIKALREASATPMAVWADLMGAGSTRDAELWEEGRTTPSPQSCERMWAHWHAWVRNNAPLLGIPETDVETAIAKPPLLLPATTPWRTLTQYALMLHGQRFTLNPNAAQPERK